MKNIRLVLFFLLSSVSASFAVRMTGKVVDFGSSKPLASVNIYNVHSGKGMTTDESGNFTLEVKKGDLIEFRKLDYKVARVSIKSDNIPKYFHIQMSEGAFELDEVLVMGRGLDPVVDSAKKRELYRQALEHYRLDGLDAVQHPFDALSKRNRQIWRFQKNYEYWEQDKFIDYVFNDRLIVQLTNLGSDSLQIFKKLYRPSYPMIRSMNDYQYYTYIKESVARFRKSKMRIEALPGNKNDFEIYESEQ